MIFSVTSYARRDVEKANKRLLTRAAQKRAWITLGAVILLYACLTYYAARRELSHDELFTYYIAQASSFAKVMNEIQLDLNPPLMYLAGHAAMAIFGNSAFAVRLPAMIGFLMGSLCLYRVVERRLTAAYGLLALLVFWSTPFFGYATEARPYGLLAGFFGLAMLAYQYTSEFERSRWCVPLLAAAVTGMMTSHFFALFYIVPFGLAEVIRTARSRKADVAVWAALGIPCAFPFVYVRVMTRYAQTVFPPEFQASIVHILRYFSFSLKVESAALVVAGGAGLLAAARMKTVQPRWWSFLTPLNTPFVAGLLLVPFMIGAVLMRSHAPFFPRYAMPTALAYGILFSALLAAVTERAQGSAAAAVAVLGLWVCVYNTIQTHQILESERHQFFEAGTGRMPLDKVRPDLPLVAASGLTFLQMDHYSNAATDSRLFYLTGGELALRYAHATIFEGMQDLKKYFPIRANVVPYGRFVAEHPRFLVLGTTDYPEDWLLRYLLASHAEVRLLGEFKGPYKDHEVYEVTVQDGAR